MCVPRPSRLPRSREFAGSSASSFWALCTVARSGSTWFSQLVASTGQMGQPREHLLLWPEKARQLGLGEIALDAYLWHLMRTQSTGNGVFAIKGDRDHLAAFFEYFPAAPCVRLSRRDRVAQAVSWHRAHDGHVWTKRHDKAPPPTSSRAASVDRVLFFYDEIGRREQAWDQFFATRSEPPLSLVYEDVCHDPLVAVRAVARHIGIDPLAIDRVESPLRVVRDASTAELTAQARRVIAARKRAE